MKITLLLLLAMTLPLSVSARDKGGNGGVAVVCRDTNGAIQSAELLDLFEANLPGYKGKISVNRSNDLTVQTILDQKMKFLSTFFAEPYEAQSFLENRKKEVNDYIVLLEGPMTIMPTGDALPMFGLAKGCQYENVAQYDDETNLLTVDNSIWKFFTNTDKAALILHEIIYKNARLYKTTSVSTPIRRIVLGLFNQTQDALILKLASELFIEFYHPALGPAILGPKLEEGNEIGGMVVLEGTVDVLHHSLLEGFFKHPFRPFKNKSARAVYKLNREIKEIPENRHLFAGCFNIEGLTKDCKSYSHPFKREYSSRHVSMSSPWYMQWYVGKEVEIHVRGKVKGARISKALSKIGYNPHAYFRFKIYDVTLAADGKTILDKKERSYTGDTLSVDDRGYVDQIVKIKFRSYKADFFLKGRLD